MSPYRKLNIAFFLVLFGLGIADVGCDVPWWCYALPVLLYVVRCVIGSFILFDEFFMAVRSSAKTSAKQIALTFDDGPLPGNTERVLAILEEAGVKAAFFCIGSRMAVNESLLTKIHQAGHIIGNHSFYHQNTFGFLSEEQVVRELSDTDDNIQRATGKAPRLFRPPFGVTSPMIAKAVARREYLTIGWSIRSFDTVIKDPAKLYRRITARVKTGDIVLFHDHSETMLSILPSFIQFLRQEGFEPVRLDRLLNENAYR